MCGAGARVPGVRCGPASLACSGLMPHLPAGPCSLQSRHDNKTNNFLDLLSWTPFIFPLPQGRTDLMVGPKCGSCTVTGGWGRPGRAGLGQPGLPVSRPAASLLPVPSLFTASIPLPPSFPFFLSPSCCCCISPDCSLSVLLPSFLGLIPSPLCVCPPLCLPLPTISVLPASLPRITAFRSLLPTSPRSSAGCLSGASVSPCSPLCWADPGGAFPWDLLSSCCQGRGSWLAGAGGRCPPGESWSSHQPLQAGRVQGGQTLV